MSQTQTYDVPRLVQFNHSPRFPTITPKTVCDDKSKWGTWILERNLDTKDIVRKQKECVNAPKEKPEQKDPGVKIENPGYTEIDVIETTLQPHTPSSINCELRMALEFPKFKHYCRDNDLNTLNLNDMTNAFCTTGNYSMKCINPDTFTPQQKNISCDNEANENKGMFYCSDGTVSCKPCSFDRLALERRLHQGFLNDFCNSSHGSECRTRGINSDTRDVYNRGFRDMFA